MSRTWFIAAGVVATVAASFIGLVALPEAQLASLAPLRRADGQKRPSAPQGAISRGRKVYLRMGCVYCHSQQIRPRGFGGDIQRGWGMRRTVPRDYLYDDPVLLGTMRTGPDLSNIGARQPSNTWHYLHLYNPQITSPGSIMPPFAFLFEGVAMTGGDPPAGALTLPKRYQIEGTWIVPSQEAKDLVAYLLSLDRSYPVPEAGDG